jgi:hypothetical protein
LSSLGLDPLHVEVGTDLGKGSLQNPHLLFPHGEFLLPREEQFLQLLKHYHRRHRHGGIRRRGEEEGCTKQMWTNQQCIKKPVQLS